MDSSITKTQKRNLTDMQEKFLDVLFGEAKGNPREAARIAGYSEHSYPKVIRNLKKEITELAETHLSTHSAKAATRLTDLLDEDGTTPQASIRLAAANSIVRQSGYNKKDQLDINMKAMHGIFILPAKDGTDKNKKRARTIPFGFKQSQDPEYLEPVKEELDALRQAKEYSKTCSLRETASMAT